MFLAKVFITLKSTVNDPQGQTIRGGLQELGFENVVNVRAGKYLEIYLDEDSEIEANKKVQDMCDKLLANLVIEEFHFDIQSWSA